MFAFAPVSSTPLAGGEDQTAYGAGEVDTAWALAGIQLRPVGLAIETDAALALVAVQVGYVGLAGESSAAGALAALQIGYAGLAEETDAGLALQALQILPAGVAAETSSASALLSVNAALTAEIVAALMAHELEPGVSVRLALQVILAAVSGRTDGVGSSTERYFNPAGAVARITATFDASNNRASVTLDGA